jgi:N-acetylneuraminate synthase
VKTFDFKNLFIFDLANNHQGDLEHGLNIIREMGKIAREEGVRAALKFQFRQLDTFIHPDYRDRTDVKHIPRFMGTRLDRAAFERLTEEVRKQDMVTMSTPFDEESVDQLLDLKLDVIKIGSCSATDRPLLEYVAEAGKPVIVSTAGLNMKQIDGIVSLFKDRGVNFAIMHCVAIYPTPTNKLTMNQIDVLRSRFPDIPIGWSTHEDPNDLSPVRIAYAKGAQLFERHVGIQTEKHKLNNYSGTPEQTRAWVRAFKEAVDACGGDQRAPASIDEIESLRSLMRGVFLKNGIRKGEAITRENVFFSMPLLKGQLSTSQWREGLVAERDYEPKQPVSDVLASHENRPEELIYQIMLQVKGMLNNARIFIGKESSVEISHHYGLERFREYGAVIVNCINRTYCKKLVIQLPRQKHPYHLHHRKEETFQLLWGDLEVEVDGKRTRLEPGDTILVQENQWHKFHTLDGAIFEEVSTTHYNDDSIYEDEKLAKMPRDHRKTLIPNWEAAMRPAPA